MAGILAVIVIQTKKYENPFKAVLWQKAGRGSIKIIERCFVGNNIGVDISWISNFSKEVKNGSFLKRLKKAILPSSKIFEAISTPQIKTVSQL